MFELHRQNAYRALKGDVAALHGAVETTRYRTDRDMEFRQEEFFYYFSGCTIPGSLLVLHSQDRRAVLYVPKPDQEHSLWYGKIPTMEDIRAQFSDMTVKTVDEFEQDITQCRGARVHTILNQPLIPNVPHLSEPVDDFLEMAGELRVVKDEHERAIMRRVCGVNSNAFHYAAAHFKAGMTEDDMAAYHNFACARQGMKTQAYIPIVGAGRHASCLHWFASQTVAEEGQVVLMDAGCEGEMYCSDHTRVFPAGRRFTRRQEQIYQVCLASQKAAIAAIRPGVKWEDVHFTANRAMLAGLREAGLLNTKFSVEEQLADGVAFIFQMHGLGHMVGMSIHHPAAFNEEFPPSTDFRTARLRVTRVLRPGMVLTVEPGLYFMDRLLEQAQADAKLARHMNFDVIREYQGECGGYRIEDDVFVTEDGCEVFPGPVKELDDIYRLRDMAF